MFARLFGRAVADQVTESENDRVGNEVVNAVAFTAAAYQSCVVKSLQVLRDIRLIAVEALSDFADGPFALLQHLEKAQTLRFTEHTKAPGDQLNHGVG